MARKLQILLHCSIFALLPVVANATGTYVNSYNDYKGTVQRNYGNLGKDAQPFHNYGNTYGLRVDGYNGPSANAMPVVNNNLNVNTGKTRAKSVRSPVAQKGGFGMDAGLSHQFAMWKFDMGTAGSKLHYDNVHWNVFDASAKYDFDIGNTMLRVNAGLQYGMQFGDSSMVDDDITNGGGLVEVWNVDTTGDNNADQTWVQRTHALSVGTSNDGNMTGFHAGLGLVDFWTFGDFRITPSVGYRYFKYKLETRNNYGISLDTVDGATNYCQSAGGEMQCLPFVVFVTAQNQAVLGTISGVDLNDDGVADTFSYITVPQNVAYLETENTYFYSQAGVSHSYEVEWAGPYLALDVDYDITMDDALNARIELGLPSYTSTGDQPYRPDWQHPKSLEDNAGFGDAYHFGFGANWLHSLTDSVMLTLGMTFDYYHVSGADATTYLNPEYFKSSYFYDEAVAANKQFAQNNVDIAFDNWPTADKEAYLYNLQNIIQPIDALAATGWKQESKGEIESMYKSMGIRLGIQAKF